MLSILGEKQNEQHAEQPEVGGAVLAYHEERNMSDLLLMLCSKGLESGHISDNNHMQALFISAKRKDIKILLLT